MLVGLAGWQMRVGAYREKDLKQEGWEAQGLTDGEAGSTVGEPTACSGQGALGDWERGDP